MFNENKAWALHHHGHIIGCVRYLPEKKNEENTPRLLLAIHLAKSYRSDQELCADIVYLVQQTVFDQRWRHRYQVLYSYNFDYFTVADRVQMAQDGKQWFGGTVLLDSSGVPLF